MTYTATQISIVKTKIYTKIEQEISVALKTDTFEELMNRYGVNPDDDTYIPQVTRRMKILVVGDLSGRISDYVQVAHKYGISEDNLEFINFDEIKRFNITQLEYSNKYSDIIVGPIPHKINSLNGENSLISLLENASNKEIYPKLIKVLASQEGGKLKFSVSAFKKALLDTRLIHVML